MRLNWCILALLIWLFPGCGYRLAQDGGASPVLAGKSVAIPVFGSKAYRPHLETIVTERMIEEFALLSGARVVPEREAELVLTGTILSYATSPVSYNAADRISEYRADMVLEAVLSAKESGAVLWKGRLSEGQDYPADSDVSFVVNRETAAVRDIARKFAQRLYQTIGQDF